MAAILAVYFALGGSVPAWVILVLVTLSFYAASFFAWKEQQEEVVKLRAHLGKTPLTGLRLRNELDKRMEAGKGLHNRLSEEGAESAMSEAKEWMKSLREFTEANLSVSDFDAVNNPHGLDRVTEAVGRELANSSIPNEIQWLRTALAHRCGKLHLFRETIR